MASHQQQRRKGKEIHLLQAFAILLGCDHGREQIVSRPLAALGQKRGEVVEDLMGGLAQVPCAATSLKRIEELYQGSRPRAEPVTILHRHTEKLRDGDHRERMREIGHHLHLPALRGSDRADSPPPAPAGHAASPRAAA